MPARSHKTDSAAPRPGLTGLAAAVLVSALAGGIASSAGAERAIELGKTRSSPAPNCSGKSPSECQVTGQVTGFQRSADGKRGLFKAREKGRIVAWSVDLAKPSKQERNVFGEAARTSEFGESPTAGVSIIRKDGKRQYKLIRSSPIMKVQSFYGQKPVVTLRQPLFMRKGDIVALTTPTWLPAFSVKRQGPDDVWVGSRARKNCEVPSSVPPDQRLEYFFAHTRPHRDVGSTRRYACRYDGARLLYWAYFVPAG